MKQRLLAVAALAAATVTALPLARAGIKYTYTVYINSTARYAYGALGTVRNTTDNRQVLACETYYYADGTPTYMYCYAGDAGQGSAYCSTDNPVLVTAAGALQGDSFLRFEWDTYFRCTKLVVINGSQMEPKKP